MPLTLVLSKLRQALKVKANFSKEQASNPLNPSTQESSVVYIHRVVDQPEPHSETMTKQNKTNSKNKESNQSINGKKETIKLYTKSHSLIGEDSFSVGVAERTESPRLSCIHSKAYSYASGLRPALLIQLSLKQIQHPFGSRSDSCLHCYIKNPEIKAFLQTSATGTT